MGLDDLSEDIEATYAELGEELTVELDAETRNELAMLASAYDPDYDGAVLSTGRIIDRILATRE